VMRSNIFTNLIPVFTVGLAWLILKDTITLRTVLGVLLTVMGLLVSQHQDWRHKRMKTSLEDISSYGM